MEQSAFVHEKGKARGSNASGSLYSRMSLFGKTLEMLTEDDLLGLIESGFVENRVMEYKATMPGGWTATNASL